MTSGSIYIKMKHQSKVSALTRSIIGLFVTKKPNITHLNHKEEYYNAFYFNHKLCDGVKLVADIEGSSKKAAAELLMKAGVSSYLGDKLAQYIKDERAAREHGQKVKMTRFIIALRRYARAQDMDISKFI